MEAAGCSPTSEIETEDALMAAAEEGDADADDADVAMAAAGGADDEAAAARAVTCSAEACLLHGALLLLRGCCSTSSTPRRFWLLLLPSAGWRTSPLRACDPSLTTSSRAATTGSRLCYGSRGLPGPRLLRTWSGTLPAPTRR